MKRIIYIFGCVFLVITLCSSFALSRTLKKTLEKEYYDVHKPSGAISVIEEYIAKNPDDYMGYHEKAKWQVRTGNVTEETVWLINKALELCKDKSVDFTELYFDTFLHLKEKERVYEILKITTKEDPKYADFRYAFTGYVLGDYEKSIEHAKIELGHIPNCGQCMDLLYSSYACLGVLDESKVDEVNQYVKNANFSKQSRWMYSTEYYFTKGDTEKAFDIIMDTKFHDNKCCSASKHELQESYLKYQLGDYDYAKQVLKDCIKNPCPTTTLGLSRFEVMRDYMNLKTSEYSEKDMKKEWFRKFKNKFDFWVKTIIRELEGNQGKADEYYMAAVENMPFNMLFEKNDMGLIRDEHYELLRKVAERVEKPMNVFETQMCPDDSIPSGTFFVIRGEYVNDEIIRYYKGEAGNCKYVLYKLKNPEIFYDDRLPEFTPVLARANEETKEMFFYDYGLTHLNYGEQICH